MPSDTQGPAAHSYLSGIDHEALNKQILEYKRRREKGHGTVGPLWPEHTAELRKQTRKRKARPRVDDDLSPENYVQGGSDDGGGLLRSAPRATSGAPRSRAGTAMERKDQRGVDRDPTRVHARCWCPRAPSCGCRCRLHPLCCVAGEVVRPAGRV